MTGFACSVFLEVNDNLMSVVAGTYGKPWSSIIIFSAGMVSTTYRNIINLDTFLFCSVIDTVKVKFALCIQVDSLGCRTDRHIRIRDFDGICALADFGTST